MSLTTPVTKDFDAVYPGENWFFYWKTSAALWKTKLEELVLAGPLIVPVNWGLHSEDGELYDFAKQRPETDLKRLVEIAGELGREVIFLVPLTPLPFLPNGGVPALLARTISLSKDGSAYGIVDNDGRINKLYSFYDPRIYQGYRKFVWQLAQYFTETGISAQVAGLYSGYLEDGCFYSYMEDSSKAFEQGLMRYIASQKIDVTQENLSPEQAKERDGKFRQNYQQMVNDLYLESAKECLSGNWAGTITFSFLGGHPRDVFNRYTTNLEHSSLYFSPFMQTFGVDVIPATVLLPPAAKTNVFKKFVSDQISPSLLYKKLDSELYEDEYSSQFSPLVFFEIYLNSLVKNKVRRIWQSMGLYSFLDHTYKGTYRLNEYKMFLDQEKAPELKYDKVYFFSGDELGKKEFQALLKIFMNGGRVVFNTDMLDTDLKRRLELFLAENSLNVQKINYITNMSCASLGAGVLVLFEGKKLEEVALPQQLSFWEKVISYLGIGHLEVTEDEGTFYHWKTRSPLPGELNYEEVRRVSFYNPSSYKKKVRIKTSKQFAFTKIINEISSNVKSGPLSIDVEMSPGGSVSLDFGYFES